MAAIMPQLDAVPKIAVLGPPAGAGLPFNVVR
jgi:hypothetical protein